MDKKIIIKSNLDVYGINSFINKFSDNSKDVFDLENLKTNFIIDYKFNFEEQTIEKSSLPAFTSLNLNKKIILGDSKYTTSYNYPPIGPIENGCYCSFCNQYSPNFHETDCPYPDNKSLFLTIKGAYIYLFMSSNSFNDKLDKLIKHWRENTLSQDILNNILLLPNSVKINDNVDNLIKYPANIAKTNIRYFEVIKVRGPNKLEYKTATEKFNNAIIVSYEYLSKKSSLESDLLLDLDINKTSIRIYKNGLINLINIPRDISLRKQLYNSLITKLNNSSLDLDEFNNLLIEEKIIDSNNELKNYKIIDEISYIHSLTCQFNLWTEKFKYKINFINLYNLISPYNSKGELVDGKYSKIIQKLDRQLIILKTKSGKIEIINFEHIIGKVTKLQTLSREVIKCTILPYPGIKISLQIHKHGTFQMSISYCNPSDVRNNICSEINKSKPELKEEYFNLVQSIFVDIFKNEINKLILENIEYNPEEEKLARNTITGNAPPKRPGVTTETCRSNDPRPGYSGLRPIPYSFSGSCPESNQFINPIGELGNDGLYYPCCATKTATALEKYKKYLIKGFPKNKIEAEEYGLVGKIDNRSGILVPGSYNIGSETEALINGEWNKVKIIKFADPKLSKHKKFIVEKINEDGNGKQFTVDRENLKRDTRYFRGLNKMNREELINCIIKNLNEINNNETILELDNLQEIKQLINIPDYKFNPILTTLNIEIFELFKFYVGSIPYDSEFYYLYIKSDSSYFINLNGNKIDKSIELSEKDSIVFAGYLNKSTMNYYITDILYLNKILDSELFSNKIDLINNLYQQYFMFDDLIDIVNYETNIIKGSKDLIIENSSIYLIFMSEEKSDLNFKLWIPLEKLNIQSNIVLQIMRKNKSNYYLLGYENTKIDSEKIELNFDDINIPKKFIDENELKINDYINFKFDINIQTGQFAKKFLLPMYKVDKPNSTYSDIMTKLVLITNPIKQSFFMNNMFDDQYIWSIPKQDKVLYYDVQDQKLKILE